MKSLTFRERLGVPLASETGPTSSLKAFLPAARRESQSNGHKIFGGLFAVSIQAIFLTGLAYGTMQGLKPDVENLTVVNILDETPVMEEELPPPPPTLETPVINMIAPLVTITQPEPPPRAPTAVVSEKPAPPPPPPRVGDGERLRLIADFQRSLQRHLIRHMRYPAKARAQKEEGVVYVRVAMNRAGYVISAKIQDASDFPLLNEEAIAVVQRAQPLPQPPVVVPGDPVDLIIPVTFSLRMGRGGRGGRGGRED